MDWMDLDFCCLIYTPQIREPRACAEFTHRLAFVMPVCPDITISHEMTALVSILLVPTGVKLKENALV